MEVESSSFEVEMGVVAVVVFSHFYMFSQVQLLMRRRPFLWRWNDVWLEFLSSGRLGFHGDYSYRGGEWVLMGFGFYDHLVFCDLAISKSGLESWMCVDALCFDIV